MGGCAFSTATGGGWRGAWAAKGCKRLQGPGAGAGNRGGVCVGSCGHRDRWKGCYLQEAAAEMINKADGKGLGAGSGFSLGRGLFDCTAGRLSRLRGSVRQSTLRKGLGKRPKAARGTAFVRGGLEGSSPVLGQRRSLAGSAKLMWGLLSCGEGSKLAVGLGKATGPEKQRRSQWG